MNSTSTYGELIWQTKFLKIHDIINLILKNVEQWTILLLKLTKNVNIEEYGESMNIVLWAHKQTSTPSLWQGRPKLKRSFFSECNRHKRKKVEILFSLTSYIRLRKLSLP